MNATSLVAVFGFTSLESRLDQLLRLLVLCFDGSRQVGFEVKPHRGVLRHAQAVCGIALCTELPTARLTACTAIIACGSWFHDRPREEQDFLLHLLKRAKVENAWPTASLAQGLMEERD